MKHVESRRSITTITREIAHSEQSAYIEVPFEMPEEVEELVVTYSVESHGEQRAVIDLGLRDTNRVRGWSGGARKSFQLGLEQSTPGYLSGELTSGNWAVLHNAYKVPSEGCTVHVTIEFLFKTPRWLKGDLHTHSVNSDGTFTLEENAAIMEELGCDFIAMTDHNTVSQNFTYPRSGSVVMIPGMEFTTNFGHSNFLGVADPILDFRVKGQEDVNAKIAEARANGAKIVINHPHCEFCPWEWDFAVDHDWVEVWNGPFADRNARAIDWWHHQLVSGRRLVAVGGSDTHRPDPYVKHAMPCTWVYAAEKSSEGILKAIDLGRVFITYAPEGPFVQLNCGSYMVGEVVPTGDRSRLVTFHAEDLKVGDTLKLISDTGVEKEVEVSDEDVRVLDIQFEAQQATFIRAEVWRHFEEVNMTLMAALTNPIYFEK